jgi:hypothetical protein
MDFTEILVEALKTGEAAEAIAKRRADARIESLYLDSFTRAAVFALASKLLDSKEIESVIDAIHQRIAKELGDQDLGAIAVIAKTRENIIATIVELKDSSL